MKWGRTRALVAFAIMGLSIAPAALTSCGGDDSGSNDTDASYGHRSFDAGSAAETSAPVVCAPVLPDAWTPPPFEPPVMNNASCSKEQVQTFYDDCFGTNETQSACKAYYDARENATCMACLYTPFGQGPPLGSILGQENGLTLANYPGCIALIDGDFSETGCAAKVEALDDCESDACTDACPIDTSSTAAETASEQVFEACATQAGKTICASEKAAEACANNAKYAGCKFSGFEAYAIGIGDFMCASGTVDDAGIADASDDADDAFDADVSDGSDADLDAADD